MLNGLIYMVIVAVSSHAARAVVALDFPPTRRAAKQLANEGSGAVCSMQGMFAAHC